LAFFWDFITILLNFINHECFSMLRKVANIVIFNSINKILLNGYRRKEGREIVSFLLIKAVRYERVK
jgi:hypothetical protein